MHFARAATGDHALGLAQVACIGGVLIFGPSSSFAGKPEVNLGVHVPRFEVVGKRDPVGIDFGLMLPIAFQAPAPLGIGSTAVAGKSAFGLIVQAVSRELCAQHFLQPGLDLLFGKPNSLRRRLSCCGRRRSGQQRPIAEGDAGAA